MKIKILAATVAATMISCAAYAAGIVNVDQKGLAFGTASLTVAPGTVVSFNNGDSTSHNILVSGEGVNLNSGLQAPGVSFKAPFLKPGTYQVMCGIHPKMKMTVTVK